MLLPTMRCGALLLAAAAAGHAQAQPIDPMAQRLAACTACHGREGRATNAGYFPRIAGKPAGYLYNQLVNFQLGRRRNPAMAILVEHLSDAYLREIGAWFGALDLPYPPAQTTSAPAAVLARGEQLVRQGDQRLGLPACTACHGARMTGVLPALPGLLGLPRDYLVAQLGAWRTGLRQAAAPDCMATVAKSLTADDASAVATYLSAQTPPADAHPAAAVAAPLPLDCGSGLR